MNTDVILLVEDNPDDEALTVRALQKNGIRNPVVVAHDGVETLDYLFGTGAHAGRDTRCKPAVVLIDLNLPRLDGQKVLRRIRADARTCRLPVVVLTNSVEEKDMRDGYAGGINSDVRKPVNFNQFADAVGHLGTFWLTLNERPVT